MPQFLWGHWYFDGVFPILPSNVFQASLLGEWRGAVEHFGITALIELDDGISIQESFRHNLSWPIDDCDELPDMEEGKRVARTGAEWVRNGEKLIITCLGGMNRSGLVCGLVLWELGIGDGEQIFQMIKDANPDGLWRRCFQDHIRSLPHR